jgi:hypothetical protein
VGSSTAKDDDERRKVNAYNPRSKVGSILWLIACSRPDLMHSLKNPSQFLTDPGKAVVHALNRIGRYLLGTMNEGLRLYGTKGQMLMQVASDADDAGVAHSRSMLCDMAWIGPPLGDESKSVPRTFLLYTNHWSIVVASGSMESEIYAQRHDPHSWPAR